MREKNIFVIAEAGSNHNGELETALELVRKAADAGADAVKFQDFTLDSLFAVDEYTKTLDIGNKGWTKHVDRVSVPEGWHRAIAEEARRKGIRYFSTPFSLDAVDALDGFVPFYKIASCDITFHPLLERVASKGKGVFLSTGASTLDEIAEALRVLRPETLPFVCLLHCVMLYPAPHADLNLSFIDTLGDRFGLPVGFSDHSEGTDAALVALGKGIRVIEKHFTLDKSQSGADHAYSLDPGEFGRLVLLVRRCEEMLGPPDRFITEKEAKERIFARRGLYAARDLKKGERMTLDGFAFLRPNVGIGAEKARELEGKVLMRDVRRGEPIGLSMFGSV
jgi:N,N'-diacetyllegionaminate synthase